MMKEYFLSKVCNTFKPLENEYNLSCVSNGNEIVYLSDKIHFLIYLENYFEINILFQVNKKDSVYLNEILNYINKETLDNKFKYNNQVSTENDVDFVLSNAYEYLKIILPFIENNSDFLLRVVEYQKAKTDELYEDYLLSQMKSEFEEKWQEKDYFAYIKIYEKYKDEFTSLDILLTESQKKRLQYSKSKV